MPPHFSRAQWSANKILRTMDMLKTCLFGVHFGLADTYALHRSKHHARQARSITSQQSNTS